MSQEKSVSTTGRTERGAAPHRYIVITPVRDEAPYIDETIRSVMQQTVLPTRWIIVDDGSTDATPEIIDRYAGHIDWIEAVHRENRGFRANGGGVMDAFYAGHARLKRDDWDFIVKLDADLSFAPDYFEKCFREFAADPKLGIGGGTICRIDNGQRLIDSAGDPPFHVRGATKIYRRACWEAIAPLMRAPGWDTIDEVKANLHGWTTRTFADLPLIQHKPTGSADGKWRNWFKNGRANYITGYHPLFMLAKCARRAFRQRPFLIESVALLAGYCSGYVRRIPRIEDREVIRYLRRQQVRHLFQQPSIYAHSAR